MQHYFGGFTDFDVNKYPALIYAEAQATTDTTTTSGTDVLINGMTITPAAGTYLVNFSTSFVNSSNGSVTYFSIYAASVKVAHSERRGTSLIQGIVIGNQPNQVPVATQCLVTVNGTQAIEARWRRDSGTSTAHQRTLTILKIADV